MTGETPTFRRAARVLLLDEDSRVLLVRFRYHGRSWWVAPEDRRSRREPVEPLGLVAQGF
jgi:hypothetical protein